MNIVMLDFQIENSVGCRKDYLSLEGGLKYCGNSLYRRTCKTYNLRHDLINDVLECKLYSFLLKYNILIMHK